VLSFGPCEAAGADVWSLPVDDCDAAGTGRVGARGGGAGGGARGAAADGARGGGTPFRGLFPEAKCRDVNDDRDTLLGYARDRITIEEGRLVGRRARMAAARGSIVRKLLNLSSDHE
jgi:hypothetical protein